jgi:hypothetical protein
MEPERLGRRLAERLDASVDLLSETRAAEPGMDETLVITETRKQPLMDISEFRKRLVIEETQRRWWQPKNR